MSLAEMLYEIKFQLDGNQVLSDDHKLYEDLVKINQAAHQQLDIRFLDTSELDFYHSGWILRGRLKQNKNQWEITYKKRTAIPQSETIDEAVQRMKEAGFDPNDPLLSIEVDWSGEHQTLNYSYEVKAEVSELQNSDDWQSVFLRHAPESLQRERWAELDLAAMLSKTILYGPINSHKYKGEWSGLQVSVEVWNVSGQSIAEITIEARGATSAQSNRELLKRSLQQNKLLPLQIDFSKTGWALSQLGHAELLSTDPFELLRQGGYNLYFRHAQPENSSDDPGLSALGREQAKRLGELLLAKQIPLQIPILSSPLRRAKETAEFAFTKEKVRIEERLIQAELEQLLETTPSNDNNQLFVAHHHHFSNQLNKNESFDYLDAVLLRPLGHGKGYTLLQVRNLLQDSLIKYGKLVAKVPSV